MKKLDDGANKSGEHNVPDSIWASLRDAVVSRFMSTTQGAGSQDTSVTTFDENVRGDPEKMKQILDMKIQEIRSMQFGTGIIGRTYSSDNNQDFLMSLQKLKTEVQVTVIHELLRRYEDLMNFAYGCIYPGIPNGGLSVLFTEVKEILDPGKRGAKVHASIRFLVSRKSMQDGTGAYGRLFEIFPPGDRLERSVPLNAIQEEILQIQYSMLLYEDKLQEALAHLEAKSMEVGDWISNK